jgi:hypothetical protein
MGHQINYYMTPKDVEALGQRFQDKVEFTAIPWRYQSEVPPRSNSLFVECNGVRERGLYLLHPQHLNQVVSRYIESQSYWTVQGHLSPVVEFDVCFFDNTILRRGRVYYVDRFLDTNHVWVTKSEDFRKWAKTLFSIVKKSLKPLKPGDRYTEYIGEDAAKWVAAGGMLVT